MKRRRLVALVSAAVLFTLGLVAIAAVFFVTNTDMGREQLRRIILPFVSSKIKGGSIYIGKLGGNFISGLTIDTIAIRDKYGELFISTGHVTLSYNPRDLIDDRIYVHSAQVEHPYVHLIQRENGNWNFREIFASDVVQPKLPKELNTRSFGDYVVVDSTSARNTTFLLTLPWHPDSALHGTVRDSVIRFHLTHPERAVSRTSDGFGRTYAWTNGRGLISHARLADPDSNRFGQSFRVATLSVDEYQPTFKFLNLTADVRHLGDSVTFDVSHFDMPASTGHGHGKVWWGSDLPMRYDVAIRGDSVSLDDVNWVYPRLPRTGGGTLDLLIKNDPKNLQVIDFKLAKMDVRSTKSHVTGDMTFGTGQPVLLVRNVDLRADPLDFDLIRTLNGKPFPEDWQGQIIGTARGPGGPLTHFVVDDARGAFVDAHVRGATSRFSGKGELDILNPAFTAFHDFHVNAQSLDLRTIEYLFPNFPRLGGFVAGTATLDSSWLDVRFSNANVTHQDGPGDPSRFSGSGRITDGGALMIYDVALDAEPVNLAMVGRSLPSFSQLHGLMNGPVRARGTAPDLQLSTSLQGPPGAFSFDGRVDLDSIGGYGAHGGGQFSSLDLASVLARASIPAGPLSGHYDIDVAGETVAALHGGANLDLERTVFDSVRVYPSYARLRFDDGRVLVDSLRIHTAAATLTMERGGVGLPKGRTDSLRFTVSLDSLGGLRRYLSHPDTSMRGAAATLPDSLSGTARLSGVVSGTFDSLNVVGRLDASSLYINKDRGDTLNLTFDLRDVLRAPSGAVAGRLDNVTLMGVALDNIGGNLRIDDATHARFSASALSHSGPTASTTGRWSASAGAQSVLIDSLGFTTADAHWGLASPARLTIDSVGRRLDSLVFRNADSSVIALTGDIPDTGTVRARVRATRVPLRDFGALAQVTDTLTGVGDVDVSVSGTRLSPRLSATGLLTGVKWKGVSIDRVSANAQYRDARLVADMDVVRDGRSAFVAGASLPLNMTLFGTTWRDDSLSGFVRADTTDMALVQTLFPSGTKLTGRLDAHVVASGTPGKPVFMGDVTISNGTAFVPPLNVTLTAITGGISGGMNAARQDSVSVDLRAANVGKIPGSVAVKGWAKNLTQENPTFSLAIDASNFHAFNRRSLADLYLTTTSSLELRGSVTTPTLTGALRVDQGAIYLADRELARKQPVEIVTDNVARGLNLGGSTLVSTIMTNLQVPNVTVVLGNDVRLRSTEANVKLGGDLRLVTSTASSSRTVASSGKLVPGLALEGTLTTVSGTYKLNLGPVQREFQVQPNGTVTFDGTSADNPTLDIKALYNVKLYRDRDIGVIVNLNGRLLPYPVIDFKSTADYDISTSDLLSYLLTGRPGLDFGSSGAVAQVASLLAPTISAMAADRLRQSFGSVFDVFRFELGTGSSASDASSGGFFSAQNLRQYLYGATIGAERQFGNNVYLNVNTGLCQFNSDFNGGRLNLLTGLGAKAEYRFDPTLSVQVAYDPPTANRTCSQQQSVVGLVNTPSQFSFSLSHTWHF